MRKTGRNDPCPCGSGKKYKKCCMARDREEAAAAARPTLEGRVFTRCLDWLFAHHEDVAAAVLEEFFGPLGEEVFLGFDDAPPVVRDMVLLNAHEWLLADGQVESDDEEVWIRDLLLGPDGPLLEAEERAWLERFLSRPLGLYEVQESIAGEGLTFRDLLHPGDPEYRVPDPELAKSMVRWEVLGARMIPTEDGAWQVSAAFYPFDRSEHHSEWIEDVRKMFAREARGDRELERELLALWIPGEWLVYVLDEPAGMPELVDASTGEPLLLVTDHYRVRDWPALEAALADQPDVEGDREAGWTRFEPLGGGAARGLLSLDPGRGDRLAVFGRTRSRADEGRKWLEGIAGGAIRFRTREMTDPQGFFAAGGAAGAGGPASSDGVSPPTELVQELFEHQYANWADEPIPALGGKTPRKAMRSKKGRARVMDLLKLYEHGEERAAREEDREPASFQFLRDQLGLE